MTAPLLIAIAVLIGVASATQSIVGFGYALLVVPCLTVLLGPKVAVVASTAVGTALVAWNAVRWRTDVRWPEALTVSVAALCAMPIGLVVLTRARLQEVVDEAVQRGRITRSDAAELVAALVAGGRSGADGVLSGPLDMARRVAGGQPAITGYDDLTAAEIADRLDGLDLAQLRRIRTYERANANRKTVLAAVERRLA